MKSLSQGILNSFKNRLRDNEELVVEVEKTLEGFRKNHQGVVSTLNDNAVVLRKALATSEKNRMNSYNSLIGDIHGTISNTQQEVSAIKGSVINLIGEYTSKRSNMAVKLHQTFLADRVKRKSINKTRHIEFDKFMNHTNSEIMNIYDKVTAIFKNTNEMLATFDREHQKMSGELKSELNKNLTEREGYTRELLSGFQERLAQISKENKEMSLDIRRDLTNGEKARIKEYNDIIGDIQGDIKRIKNEVLQFRNAAADMLNNFAKERKDAAAEWNNMESAIAEIKRTAVEEQSNTSEQAAINLVDPDENLHNALEVDQEKEKVTSEVEISLDEKVLDFINSCPQGVKISELEKSLGETRIKLGLAAKGLWESGKVEKIEKSYFPLNHDPETGS